VADDPDNWWKSPQNHIGNGPFTITGTAETGGWTFAASEHYWQGRPKLDGIEYIPIEDNAEAFAAYQAGELDIASVDPEQLADIEADPDLLAQLLTYPQAGTFNLAMSLNKEPFTDKKVREAFAYAFDRETWCAEVQHGTCAPTPSWIPPGVPGYIESDRYGFDPEAARLALADSTYGGAENLPEITLSYFADNPSETEHAEWIAREMRNILGIELVLEPVPGDELFARTNDAATYPQLMMFGGWFQDYSDPQNWLSVVWTCDATFAQAAGYCNEEFDRLTALGDTTVDPVKRLAYYEQAQRILIEDVPGPFLFNPTGPVLIKPNITGITPISVDAVWPGTFASLMTIDKAG
jgi:oligopeptide transport system substrate-binding protein